MRPPALPSTVQAPREGSWLWTCRAGFEGHLFEELAWLGSPVRLLGPALVEAKRKVRDRPWFGRMGFEVFTIFEEPVAGLAPERIARAVAGAARGRPFELQAWSPDTPVGAAMGPLADALSQAVQTPGASRAEVSCQLCVLGPQLAVVGAVAIQDAASRAPGGRHRMRREAGPSRAGLKLEEALEGYGLAPSRGERCVDLGAAPGGWTARLLTRGARVVAVDPAKLAPDLQRNPHVQHVQQSAFAYAPPEPVDWLFCDMAWRPLEVANLLAKWGRRGWALHLCANIKLPMKDKNPILHRVKQTLESGWTGLQIRQLYHDRDEVTVTGRRLGTG